MNLIETIDRALRRHNLIHRDERVVVGVSGGADSVALLRGLHSLGFTPTVAHLNHQLRGTESEGDETFVRKLAEELMLPIVVKSVAVDQFVAPGVSLEMAARQARHDFFAEFGGATIALAHHADDQVETFFLKLARGAGLEGLGGMLFSQQIGSLHLVRPMLELRRSEITEWLTVNGFSWREDRSNAETIYLRNRIRHTVLPMLEHELNPGIREAVLRTMNILRAESEFMCGAAGAIAETNDLKIASVFEHPLALQRRILRSWLFNNGAGEAGFEAVERLLELMHRIQGSGICELPDGRRVVLEYGRMRIESAPDAPDSSPVWVLSVEPGTGWKRDAGTQIGRLPAEASFDADRVGDAPIEVRTWRSGDRMCPLGMSGSRKLQDIFTDQKVPRSLRDRVPVVVCRGDVIWLPGYRIDRRWAVRSASVPSVHVRVETALSQENQE